VTASAPADSRRQVAGSSSLPKLPPRSALGLDEWIDLFNHMIRRREEARMEAVEDSVLVAPPVGEGHDDHGHEVEGEPDAHNDDDGGHVEPWLISASLRNIARLGLRRPLCEAAADDQPRAYNDSREQEQGESRSRPKPEVSVCQLIVTCPSALQAPPAWLNVRI